LTQILNYAKIMWNVGACILLSISRVQIKAGEVRAMILMILLVIVIMFYLQRRRPTKAGAQIKTVSTAPNVEHIPVPEPPALDDGQNMDRYLAEPAPLPLDDEHRASLVGWRRLYLFLALLAFLAAIVLLVWAASEVGCEDRVIFLASASLWLLFLAGILFVGELMRRSLALAGVSKRDGVDGA
jgi:hypothetical protein